MATLAFFFALTGGAMAGVKYITASDTIPSPSDLAGSTYGNPLIAAGKVTTGKIADGAVTNVKLASSARLWAVVQSDGLILDASKSDVTANHLRTGVYIVDFGSGTPDLEHCAAVVTTLFQFPAVFVAAIPTGSTTVEVDISNTSNDPADDSFSIAVFC